MAWADRLQKASFRGVEFFVDADDASFGRRVQVHEYPQRDKPYVEDLGRKAREIRLTAFLIGAEYMAARDRLLEAIEQLGPGELVHPWHGRMTVSVSGDGCRVTHSREEGGLCRISLSFVESGELAFPAAADAPGAKTLLAAEGLEELSIEKFAEDFSLDGVASFVFDDALSAASDMLDTLDDVLSSGILTDPIGTLQSELSSLLPGPAGFARRLFGLFGKSMSVLGAFYSIAAGDFRRFKWPFLRAMSSVRAASRFPAVVRSASAPPARVRLYDNRDALSALHRRAVIVQASVMAATMPLPVYDDAVLLRSALMGALDAEAESADDDVYAAIIALRTQVYRDMGVRIHASARLLEYAPPDIAPALAVAYDLYEDVQREDEIVGLNRIRRPGFVPPAAMWILSS